MNVVLLFVLPWAVLSHASHDSPDYQSLLQFKPKKLADSIADANLGSSNELLQEYQSEALDVKTVANSEASFFYRRRSSPRRRRSPRRRLLLLPRRRSPRRRSPRRRSPRRRSPRRRILLLPRRRSPRRRSPRRRNGVFPHRRRSCPVAESNEAYESVWVLSELGGSGSWVYDADFGAAKVKQGRYGYSISETWPQLSHTTNGGFTAAMALYKKTDDQQQSTCVLAIRGTLSGPDLDAGMWSIIYGFYPRVAVYRAKMALDFYRKECGENRVLVTGHSLGGLLAEIVATRYNVPGIAFCAPAPGRDCGPCAPENFQILNAESDPVINTARIASQIATLGLNAWDHKKPVIKMAGLEQHGSFQDWLEQAGTKNMTNQNVLNFTIKNFLPASPVK